MNINYESADLIKEVEQDIQEFGGQMKVYAVYSLFPGSDKLFITDYVHADKPERDEYMTDKEYSELIKMFKKQLKTLNKTKHELMDLSELLTELKKQDTVL